MATSRLVLLISGKVQGVFFRASTVEVARKLSLTGYARNLSDGRVEVIAEGEPQSLQALATWCEKGPPAANVKGVDVSTEAATGEFQHFDIR